MNRLHSSIVIAAIALLLSPVFGQDAATTRPATAAEGRPLIEVAFVLDTTGSMSGLIEGAKQKIWSIANQMIAQEPRPRIRFALVGYRDRGDEYITTLHNLTDDIDAVFANLQTFSAGGGGDGPESVNQALHEAVHKIDWSADRKVLKIIFLVGDAPPHMDYANDIPYTDVCKQAMGKDLIINTIQCGSATETQRIWQEIARAAEGSFIAIGQQGDMTITETPFDAELADAARKLNETVIVYGDREQTEAVAGKLSSTVSAPAAVIADRAKYNRLDDGKAVQGAGDLVADVQSGQVTLEALGPEVLPEAMREMTREEQAAMITRKQQDRAALNEQINTLTRQRDAHLKAERQKLAREGKADGFDDNVSRMVAEQAARKRSETE